MRSVHAALLGTVALAAGAGAQSPRAPYTALGTEPFWNLTLDGRTMRLEEPDRPPTVARQPEGRPSFNGTRYVAPRMTVDVTRAPCSDGMSDRVYRDTVTVQVRGRTLRGCGGGVGRPGGGSGGGELANTRWTVVAVDGRAVRGPNPLTVNFTRDRVEGRLCNSYGGTYRLNGDRLTVGSVVSTRMLCRGPAQVAENALFALWRRPASADLAGNSLTLSGAGSELTLRRVR